jgi:hypothetical protein
MLKRAVHVAILLYGCGRGSSERADAAFVPAAMLSAATSSAPDAATEGGADVRAGGLGQSRVPEVVVQIVLRAKYKTCGCGDYLSRCEVLARRAGQPDSLVGTFKACSSSVADGTTSLRCDTRDIDFDHHDGGAVRVESVVHERRLEVQTPCGCSPTDRANIARRNALASKGCW